MSGSEATKRMTQRVFQIGQRWVTRLANLNFQKGGQTAVSQPVRKKEGMSDD
jgi:hypothetical protein